MNKVKAWLQENLKGDPILWGIVITFSLISILVVYSATGTLAYRKGGGNTEYFLFKHTSLIFVGLAFMWFAHKVNYRYYSRLSLLGLILSVPLLLFAWKFGTTYNDASRWIVIPVINQTFQPSDLAKLSLITYLASMLSKRQLSLDNMKGTIIPMLLWVGTICGLIALMNISTGLLLFLTSMLLMFIGRIPMKYIMMQILVGALCGSIALAVGQRMGTAISRIENFMDESETPFQLEQSYIAIATGDIFGKGPGKSDQRNFLPLPYSDFIYAIIIEEYGIIGGIFIVFLYLAFLYRGMMAVSKSLGAFGGLLSAGLSFSLVIQAMVNMGVTVGLGPITGLPLPLLSMGGTSLIFTGISIGIILSVSRTESASDSSSKKGNIAPNANVPSNLVANVARN
ncbi:FtsW/RodA/SpoVE family cell cycle protein [Adhaeribacter aquaticus]|uniref:FtsW/RodA/SpoVE family cell cycle protein n=1 Tax=Adhaeribacter aquaticus TaxID=299567 RepID=UPI0004161E1E|nr:FtsW/RodA/SpoVE family cell cycle protein [Adhaeribacter aquaticus]